MIIKLIQIQLSWNWDFFWYFQRLMRDVDESSDLPKFTLVNTKQILIFKLIHKARAVACTILTSVLLNNIN